MQEWEEMLVSVGSSLLLKWYSNPAAGIVRAWILQCCGKRADSGFESCSIACVQIYCSNGQTKARCTQRITASVSFTRGNTNWLSTSTYNCMNEEREKERNVGKLLVSGKQSTWQRTGVPWWHARFGVWRTLLTMDEVLSRTCVWLDLDVQWS